MKMHTEQTYFQSQPQNFAGPNSRTVAVIGNQFCASYPTELTIQKKASSFSGGDFNILDSNGNLFLAVDGRALSLRGTRILRDQYGNLLATMKKKLLSLHYTWEAYRGEGTRPENLIFTARRSTLFQLRTSLKVYLGNNAHADFKVKGSFFERSCTIYQGTTVIAEMRRKYTVSQVLMGRDTFTVTVYPGVDYAFIVALVVILDEINTGKAADAGAGAAAAASAAAAAGAAAAAAAPPAPCI